MNQSILLQKLGMLPDQPRAILTALFISLPLVYSIRKLLLRREPLPGIPHSAKAASRFFGDLPDALAAPNVLDWFASQAAEHRSAVTQIFLGPFSKPMVIVADPWEALDITSRRTKEFDRSFWGATHFVPVMPENQITRQSHDGIFKRNKQLVKNLMSPSFIHDVSAPMVYDKYTKLISLMIRKAQIAKGRPFDINRDMHDAALDIIISVSFGLENMDSQLVRQLQQLEPKPGSTINTTGGREAVFEFNRIELHEELAAFTVLSESVSRSLQSALPALQNFLYKHLSPTMRRALASVEKIRRREIAKCLARREAGQTQRCAMDQLLAQEDVMAANEGRKPNYHSEAIRSELIGYLLAGHETTSTELRWGMKYLTRYQNVQQTLRAALLQVHHAPREQGRVPTLEEIIKTPVQYLEAFIEECLRFTSTAPSVFRDALVDTEILGKAIPKGTTVVLLGNGPGMLLPKVAVDESLRTKTGAAYKRQYRGFDDDSITEFRPERWLTTRRNEQGEESEVFDSSAGPSLGFGGGPRSCFGKRLAMLKMRIFFTLVVWSQEMRPIPEALSNFEGTITLAREPKDVFVNIKEVRR